MATIDEIKSNIAALSAETENAAITPDSLGFLLGQMTEVMESSMSDDDNHVEITEWTESKEFNRCIKELYLEGLSAEDIEEYQYEIIGLTKSELMIRCDNADHTGSLLFTGTINSAYPMVIINGAAGLIYAVIDAEKVDKDYSGNVAINGRYAGRIEYSPTIYAYVNNDDTNSYVVEVEERVEAVATVVDTIEPRPFDGFTITADLIDDMPDDATNGKIVYLEHLYRFAMAVPQSDGSYLWYKHFPNEKYYQTDSAILDNVIFVCAGHRYSSVGGALSVYVRSKNVKNVETMTQAEYDALEVKDDSTFYLIVEE